VSGVELVTFLRANLDGVLEEVGTMPCLVAPQAAPVPATGVSHGERAACTVYARSPAPLGVRAGDVAVVRGARLLVTGVAEWRNHRGGHVGDAITTAWKKG